tara:strand:- start:212 stop:628 length:417 start_codon:yes stop_codon:yes gene_type:complete
MISNKTLFLAFCATTILTGCQEDHKNPLLDKPTHEVVQWIFENTSAEIEDCAQSWADPKTALSSDLERCQSVASKLAEEMNYVGFSQDVRVADLDVPIIWREFNAKVQKREEWNDSLKKHKTDPGSMENNLKGLDLLK